MKNITLLGATGSIGRSTCDVVECFPEQFRLVGMTAGANLELFEKQVRKFRPRIVSMISEADVDKLKTRLGNPGDIIFCYGNAGLIEVASYFESEIVLVAVIGGDGLLPTVAAIKAGKNIALANKETMVMAGKIVSEMAKEAKVNIIPVDSEHSAIFQCIGNSKNEDIEKLILTASGGPFREYSYSDLENVTPEKALKHPNWNMGNKITIDSATLMNKGLEVIEAYWLFGCDFDKIDVVVHPQSIIHSMVQYTDGSIIAQLGLPDMKIPILYALGYPERMKFPQVGRLNFSKVKNLSFQAPDMEKFPCLKLAFSVLKDDNGGAVVINAANEVAVEKFLAGKLNFLEIHKLIEETLFDYTGTGVDSIEEVLEINNWAKEVAQKKYERLKRC